MTSIISKTSIKLYRAKKDIMTHDHAVSSNAPVPIQERQPTGDDKSTQKRFSEFDLEGKVFTVTGGGRGLGLTMAEALVEAGAQGA
jgi:hypothetical protein